MKPKTLEIPIRFKMPAKYPMIGSIVHVASEDECMPLVVTKVWESDEGWMFLDGVLMNAASVYPAKKLLTIPPVGYVGKASLTWHDMYHEETDERMEGHEDPVASKSGDDGGSWGGRPNASPKTWWSPISYDPPLMMLSLKPQSDTAENIRETGNWVIHWPSRLVAKEVLHTAKPLNRGDCELDDVGLPWEWMEHKLLVHPLPKVQHMPYAVCWAVDYREVGDHQMFVGQVGVSGGFTLDAGIEEVLLHRLSPCRQ